MHYNKQNQAKGLKTQPVTLIPVTEPSYVID